MADLYQYRTLHGLDVSFTGSLLGQGSSDNGDRDRWTEVEVYRTTEGYAAVIHGCSRRDGEVTLTSVVGAKDAEALVGHLGKRGRFSAPARVALVRGSARDPELARALDL